MIFKWAFREIKNNPRFSLFFILNLTLGLVGFLSIDAFKTSIQQELKTRSKSFLSADMSVSSRRLITEDEKISMREVLGKFPESQLIEFFSMIQGTSNSRLVQVKAIDLQYPYYGKMELRNQGEHSTQTPKILGLDEVWVYPEILSQLGLKIGDTIKLGEKTLIIKDVVDLDSSQTFRLSNLAPKIFVRIEGLSSTLLLNKGSTVTYAHLFKFQDGIDSEALKKQLQIKLPDTAIRIDDPVSAGQDTGRSLGYLSDYLGLVTLVALFLSMLGTIYLFRSYLSQNLKQIAIWMSLGLVSSKVQKIYSLQLLILGLVSSVVAILLSLILMPLIVSLVSEFTPFTIEPSLTTRTFVVAILLSVLGVWFVSLPFLQKIKVLKPKKIFQENVAETQELNFQQVLYFIPSLILFGVLSIIQANSFKIGFLFLALFMTALVVVYFIGQFLLWILKPNYFQKWFLKHSLLLLKRQKLSTLLCFVALGLGSLLINIMPQLKVSLKSELERPQGQKLPTLFMFDIQEEQVEPLKALVNEQKVQLGTLSPMVRARILKINEEPFERISQEGQAFATREEEVEARFRNRGFNLSYRDQLSEAEEIVEGKFYESPYVESQNPPEISLEERFAERLKVKMGDLITFDVQGVEIQGKVTSFRKVRWTTFQPNFFILFPPGVLDPAPKTFLSSISQIDEETKNQLQNLVTEKFANISILDVGRTANQIFNLSDQMSLSLELMAFVCLFAGFVVLISIINHQVQTYKKDINLMKVLGAKFSDLRILFIFEFSLIGFLGAFFGVLVSLVASFVVSRVIFEGVYVFDLFWPMVTLLGVTGLSALITVISAEKVLKEKAKVYL